MQRRTTKRKYEGKDPTSWKRLKYTPKSSVANLTKKVNRILSEQERKNFDASSNALNLTAGTATIVQLNSVAQGDDATSRDGRKISMVSSQLRAFFASSATSASTSGFRVIVLVDKQSNGVSPVAGDILTSPGSILSPLTLDFKERFRVIYDNFCSLNKGSYDLSVDGATGITGSGIPMQYFYKVPEELAQVEYGGIGNIPTSGAVIMLALSEGTGLMKYYHRLRYTDT